MAKSKVSTNELFKHNKPEDAWLLINGTVWDVTAFAPTHPGGIEIILEYLGRDATKAYNEVHGPSLVSKHLHSSANKGQLDESTITEEWKNHQADKVEGTPVKPTNERPELDAIINLQDFEDAAQRIVSAKTWAFQSGAANDNFTRDGNRDWYRRIWFRPRVMVGVKDVDTSQTVLGHTFKVPIFSAPAALAKLSHPGGEQDMAKGLVAQGATIIACNNASYSFPEIVEAMPKGYPLYYQLYFNKDRAVSKKLVQEAVKYGAKAIIITADLPVVGKREADERIKIEGTFQAEKGHQVQTVQRDKKGSGLARATGSFIDPDLKWDDLAWVRSLTDLPIFIKGIQSAADARKALEYGCAGIYISNHGGRAVDTAQPSILTLMEINANCPEVLEQMEVFIDGGIRRGTDILKAICLGASAVCVGRPFLYALGYGQEGVEQAVEILKDELETAMQMVGIKRLSQAHPGLLNTSELDPYVYRGDNHPWAKKIVRRQSKL